MSTRTLHLAVLTRNITALTSRRSLPTPVCGDPTSPTPRPTRTSPVRRTSRRATAHCSEAPTASLSSARGSLLPSTGDLATLDLLLGEAHQGLAGQWEALKQAEARSQFLLGWTTTGLAVGLTLAGLHGPLATPAVRLLIVLASGCAVLGAGALVLSYWPMPVARAIAPERPNTSLLELGSVDARQLLWHALIGAYAANDRVLRRRLRATRAGLVLVSLAAAALLGALIWPGSQG
jgi:hypothetical protein